MGQSAVTQRFLQCLEDLVAQRKVRSKRHFAITLGYHAQGPSEMTSQRRDVPLELIEKAIATFHLNPYFLFGGTGEKFSQSGDSQNSQVNNITIVTDSKGDERIVHVPVSAQAGYGQMLHDPIFIRELPTYQLPDPQFKSGTYRSFEISGRSMEPTFHQNDIVIAAYVENKFWEQAIKSNQVYIVVTKQEVIIKRLINHLRVQKLIECVSDNLDFDGYTIPLDEILEIWKVRLKLTSHFEPPDDHVNTNRIIEQLEMQRRILEDLQQHASSSQT